MSGLVSDQALDAALERAGGAALVGAPRRPTPAPIASPSYRALESRSVIVDRPDGAAFFKLMHPEMQGWFDIPTGQAVAAAAGEAGVAPQVLWADAEAGALMTDALDAGWRTATLDQLQDTQTVATAMAALRALHQTPAVSGRFDAFACIDRYLAEARADGIALPDDIDWIVSLLGAARPVLLAAPVAPCRNDGSSSNIMLGPDGAVRLVDFDRAGMNDPMYDVGVLLAEITEFETDMRVPFAAYGGLGEADFARARLWAIVDDVMHALWMRICATRSSRKSLEWLKYGEWRLMRARLALHHPQFEEKLRIAGGQM